MSRMIASAANGNPWNTSEHYAECLAVVPSVKPSHVVYALSANYGQPYSDLLWTRSRMVSGDAGVSAGTELMPKTQFWWIVRPLGAGGWSNITGITKDSTGAVLGGCTVHVYRTSDDLERDQVTSDAGNGTYTIGVDTDATHYCVAYKAGSPDVAGTTVNTLIGS
jgi:hypothetical protein